MADVKVPAKLHLMSKASQKAWYKKNNMKMPDDMEGRSAAAAKKVKVTPRKEIAVEPGSVRALNAARQQAYMAKGGRQPIGAAGSGGHSSMAGSNMSTAKGMIAGIKAGFNPKVSLDPYESEKAKKVGPRSLKMKKEEVQIDEALSPERKRMFDLKLKLIKKAANKKAYTKSSKVDSPHASLNPAADMKLNPRPPSGGGKEYYREEVQIDEVTKKEAESMLGGPVKEKPKMPPGKQPAGYRYVRNLARKAMNKGAVAAVHRSMEKTMAKEEVELDEVTGYEGVKDRKDVIKRATAMNRMGKETFLAKVKARAAEMKKEKKAMKEEVKDQADVGEYDYEGDMAKSQLRSIMANSKRMHDMLEENTNLPEWVQSKITLAEDYISTASNYMQGEMNEEVEQVDEKINLAKAKMGTVIKDFKKSDAPQFKGKSMEKRRQMAIAAKLGAERDAGMREEVEQVDEVKAVKAYDKEGKLVGRYRSMDHAKQMKPGHTYKVEEEVVAEAEGKVAVTPKEKALAAHHGDKTRITFGDVLKARLKSVAAKKMGK